MAIKTRCNKTIDAVNEVDLDHLKKILDRGEVAIAPAGRCRRPKGRVIEEIVNEISRHAEGYRVRLGLRPDGTGMFAEIVVASYEDAIAVSSGVSFELSITQTTSAALAADGRAIYGSILSALERDHYVADWRK